jgi:1-acyl-sn-glycerol-3-phosphate acyltransferase
MNANIISRAILTTGFWSTVTLWDSIRGKLNLERGDEIVREWSRRLLKQVDVQLKITGLENIQPNVTYVVMSNHQSLYDIPTILLALPLTIRMVAKAELFKVPLWAQAMRSAGFVPVHRGQRERALQDLRLAQEAIGKGVNIWIAPEGTRSPDGNLLPFKSGGFLLASTAKVPILPVTIDGTRRILPARALNFVRGVEVHVKVGRPIDPADFPKKNRAQFVDAVRSTIEAGFSEPTSPA